MLSGIQLEKIAWLLDMQCIATDVGMLGKMCRAAPQKSPGGGKVLHQ